MPFARLTKTQSDTLSAKTAMLPGRPITVTLFMSMIWQQRQRFRQDHRQKRQGRSLQMHNASDCAFPVIKRHAALPHSSQSK